MDSAEANERTTNVGLYHYAYSYRQAADALLNANIRSTHPDGPIDLLYVHAIELYLKAFLRHHEYSVSDLLGLGHKYKKLGEEFELNGGVLDDEDKDVLRLIDESKMLSRSRYLVTGPRTKVAPEALDRTAKSIHATVRTTLRTAGRSVR